MKKFYSGLLVLICGAALHSVCFAQQPIKAVPLYELSHWGGHFYTTNEAERKNLVLMDYLGEGIAGYVFDQPVQGTAPLYHYEGRMNAGLRNFYTVDKKKGDDAVKSGYKYVGVCCYVAAKQDNGAVPFYSLYLGETSYDDGDFGTAFRGDVHSYTTDEQKRVNAINHLGYVSQGNEGYIWRTQITGTSFVSQMTPEARAKQYEQMLFDEGCTKTSGNFPTETKIACPSEMGYFNCENARTKNYLKINVCVQPPGHYDYVQIDTELVGLHKCSHFLGRPGQYLCPNIKGANVCYGYMKQPNSPITKCISVVGVGIGKDLVKRGCDHFLGRPDEFLCRNDDAYNACENYRLDGQVKKCVSTTKKK